MSGLVGRIAAATSTAVALTASVLAAPAFAAAPPAPTGVTAHQHEFVVAVSWTPPADTTGITTYQICSTQGVLPETPTSSEGVSCLGVEAPATTYNLFDLAVGTHTVGVWSANASFESGAPVTTTVEVIDSNNQPDLDSTTRTASSLTFTWQAVPGASSYAVVVKQGESEVASPSDGTASTVSGLTTTISGLSANTTYSYGIFPLTSDGGWGQPNTGSTTTMPGPVTGFSAAANALGTGAVTLSWSQYAGGESFDSFRILKQLGSAPLASCASCLVTEVYNASATTHTITMTQLGGTSAMGKVWYFTIVPTFYDGEVAGTSTSVSTWSGQTLGASTYGSEAYRSGATDYRINAIFGKPTQPNWTTLKLFRATGTSIPTDAGTPALTCTKALNNCPASKLFTGLTNGTTYTFAIYTYDDAGHKQRQYWSDKARATGVYLNGAFVSGTLLPHYYGNVDPVQDPQGHTHVVYPRQDGLYYGRRAAGTTTWAFAKVTGTKTGDNYPTLATRSNGVLVLGFNRVTGATTDGPMIMTRTFPNAWSAITRIGATSNLYVFRGLVRDSANVTHALVSRRDATTAAGLYSLRGNPGSWSMIKITGTTQWDSGQLTIDTGRTRIGLSLQRYNYNTPTATTNGIYTAIKGSGATAFPTPTKRAGTGGAMQPAGFSLHGTRAVLFITRPGSSSSDTAAGIYRVTATIGTAASPTIAWPTSAPVRVQNTTYRDWGLKQATSSTGEVSLAFIRGSSGQTDWGYYLLRGTTAATFTTLPTRKSADTNDYVLDLDYISGTPQISLLRH